MLTRGYPRKALAMQRVATFPPAAQRAYPSRKATQSMMRDLFLPKISATEFDINPDAMKEINHDSSAKKKKY